MDQNFNLPPGCLAKDVDQPTVLCPKCDGMGMVFDEDIGEGVECLNCDGTGEVPA